MVNRRTCPVFCLTSISIHVYSLMIISLCLKIGKDLKYEKLLHIRNETSCLACTLVNTLAHHLSTLVHYLASTCEMVYCLHVRLEGCL